LVLWLAQAIVSGARSGATMAVETTSENAAKIGDAAVLFGSAFDHLIRARADLLLGENLGRMGRNFVQRAANSGSLFACVAR